jgi:hypothetical protein
VLALEAPDEEDLETSVREQPPWLAELLGQPGVLIQTPDEALRAFETAPPESPPSPGTQRSSER